MNATGADRVSKCAHYFRLTDRTGPPSRFKPQTYHTCNTQTHRPVMSGVLRTVNRSHSESLPAVSHSLLWVFLPHTLHRCVDNCKQGQRARKHNEVLILGRGVVSHTQDMKAQAQTWRKSSFL